MSIQMYVSNTQRKGRWGQGRPPSSQQETHLSMGQECVSHSDTLGSFPVVVLRTEKSTLSLVVAKDQQLLQSNLHYH